MRSLSSAQLLPLCTDGNGGSGNSSSGCGNTNARAGAGVADGTRAGRCVSWHRGGYDCQLTGSKSQSDTTLLCRLGYSSDRDCCSGSGGRARDAKLAKVPMR